jgi:hypothetical protein
MPAFARADRMSALHYTNGWAGPMLARGSHDGWPCPL